MTVSGAYYFSGVSWHAEGAIPELLYMRGLIA
jgi:hypothetical protein